MDRIIEKSTYNGLPFWKAYHFCGFYYELHINKLQSKIGIIERPYVYEPITVLDFDNCDDYIIRNFDADTLKEVKECLR